jgi:TRAP-type C4-dicarboxylate transport system permease small subunit
MVSFLEKMFKPVMASLVFGMMILTFFDVVGRYVFNAPVPGTYEFTEMAMGVLVFTGIPIVTAREQHITVVLLDPLIPKGLRRFQSAFVSLMGAGIIGIFAWRLWKMGSQLREFGDVTSNVQIPLAPFAFYMSIMAALSVMILLGLAWHHIKHQSAGTSSA